MEPILDTQASGHCARIVEPVVLNTSHHVHHPGSPVNHIKRKLAGVWALQSQSIFKVQNRWPPVKQD